MEGNRLCWLGGGGGAMPCSASAAADTNRQAAAGGSAGADLHQRADHVQGVLSRRQRAAVSNRRRWKCRQWREVEAAGGGGGGGGGARGGRTAV